MDNSSSNIWKTGFNAGLIIGLIMVIYTLILYMAELSSNQFLGWVNFLILIGGIVWAHRTFKASGDGFMSYGQGLGLGAIMSGVAGILVGIFIFIYTSFVDPEFITRMIEEQRIALENQGFGDDQIDQTMGLTEAIMSPVMLMISSVLSYAFFGFLFSLVIAAFTKKTDPTTEL
ncbi:MAG: DUF4199 domain-containing protein [Candidatus Cyclobacteriaceae bacterium M3_2C_046]